MSGQGSALDEEPEIVNHRDRHNAAEDSDSEGSDEEDSDSEGVSPTKRFDEIMQDLKDDKLNLDDEEKLARFETRNKSYLGARTSDDRNLLHFIAEKGKNKAFDRYQPLVKLLLDRHPGLLEQKESNNHKTPLYIALTKKAPAENLVRYICNTYTNIDSVLGITCYRENCLHIAIKKGVSAKLTLLLIEKAGEDAFLAKNNEGYTPLHIAVEYDRCTDTQLDIVEKLISRCDKAMDQRTNTSLSPYQYHQYTREKAQAESLDLQVKTDGNTIRGNNRVRGKEGPGGTSGSGDNASTDVELKISQLAVDMKGPRSTLGPKGPELSLGMEHGRFNAPRRTKTGSEASYGKLGDIDESNRWLTGTESVGNKASNFISLEVPRDISRPVSSNGSIPVAARPAKEKKKPTVESADAILNYLKLYCLRTRVHDDAVEFLYGRGPEKQIYFDLYDFPSLKISEQRIKSGLVHEVFEDVLQYVALPNITVEKAPLPPSGNKISKKPVHADGRGRKDMIYIFDFLRDIKKVKRVIRVIVDDTSEPAHSDESIEIALGSLKVEIWDWRRADICSETIMTAAPDAKELNLYWSGNNAVLRGWSELKGLPLLRKLENVTLFVAKGLESTKRTKSNVSIFQQRMKRHRDELLPKIKIEVVYQEEQERIDPLGGSVETAREQADTRHKWLTCMDEFADFIQGVDPPLPLREEVIIGLIDDGVDINEQSLDSKIIGGRSYCQRDRFLSRPYYVSNGGHGTLMATLICRVCPKAQLYVVKLEERRSENMKRQITARSAARAVRAAIDRKVHIISMSWTIERTKENVDDILDLEAAIEAAAKAGILMFCAANDEGVGRDKSFPAACSGTKHIFKIGAAEASGAVWKWVGDPADVDFFFPGHNVLKERPEDFMPLENGKLITGSSVATAFATGLAALILYSVQLAALSAQKQGLGASVAMEDFKAMKEHERMKEAFLAIGTSPNSQNKYIEVWKVFASPSERAEKMGRERIEVVTKIATRLKTTTNTLE